MNTGRTIIRLRQILTAGLTLLCLITAAADDTPPVLQQGTASPLVPVKVIRYAAGLMQKFDKNTDGVVEQSEWNGILPAPQAADIDGDRKITFEELVRSIVLFSKDKTLHRPHAAAPNEERKVDPANLKLFRSVIPPEAALSNEKAVIPPAASEDVSSQTILENDKPVDDAVYEEIMRGKQTPAVKKFHTAPETLRGVPAWFLIRDTNGDGQVSLAEFAPTLSTAALALFGKLDKNGNGFIEPDEDRNEPRNSGTPPAL
jgi:hypothetical protein